METAKPVLNQPVLSYAIKPTFPRQLTMSETSDGVIITLPLPPRWVPWIGIGGQLFYAVGQATHAMLMIWFWRSMSRVLHVNVIPPKEFWLILLGYTLFTVVIALFAAHSLKMHLRWGQVPKQLRINADGMALTWLGFRCMRARRWARADVKSIDLKIVKDIFTRRTVYRVRIRFRRRWASILMLPTGDPELAEKICAALNAWHSSGNAS